MRVGRGRDGGQNEGVGRRGGGLGGVKVGRIASLLLLQIST